MSPPARDLVVVVHNHKDVSWVDLLEFHLGSLEAWDVRRLQTGTRWQDELATVLARTKVVVLMVSPDFLASDFLVKREFFERLDAEKGLVVVWILVRPSNYRGTVVGNYYCLIDAQIALADMDEGKAREALRRAVEDIVGVRRPPPPRPASAAMPARANPTLMGGSPFAGRWLSRPQPVHLGASAPRVIEPEQEFTARFAAYQPDLAPDVLHYLGEAGLTSMPRLGLARVLWKAGTTITVRLSGDGLEVSPASQELVWEGPQHFLDFDVRARKGSQDYTTRLKFDVCLGDVVLVRLRLELEVRKSGTHRRSYAFAVAPKTAFASYASGDRPRVLDRVAAIQIAAGMDIFMDCLSLTPSVQWQACLEKEILARDVFMLFWSELAATSPWVEWEWRQALQKGLDAIQAHPLDPWPKAPLPQELSSLHLGDPLMAVREVALQVT